MYIGLLDTCIPQLKFSGQGQSYNERNEKEFFIANELLGSLAKPKSHYSRKSSVKFFRTLYYNLNIVAPQPFYIYIPPGQLTPRSPRGIVGHSLPPPPAGRKP